MGHAISPEIQKIMDDYCPGRNAPDQLHRLERYREAQMQMIRHHFSRMDGETQARALETMARLEHHMYEPLI